MVIYLMPAQNRILLSRFDTSMRRTVSVLLKANPEIIWKAVRLLPLFDTHQYSFYKSIPGFPGYKMGHTGNDGYINRLCMGQHFLCIGSIANRYKIIFIVMNDPYCTGNTSKLSCEGNQVLFQVPDFLVTGFEWRLYTT